MRVLILGGGFGGLELASLLRDQDGFEVTLIDQAEAFVFGFSKLDLVFGGSTLEQVSQRYERLPGVRWLRERVLAIDPERRSVKTDRGQHRADVLVVGLGADYDVAATPGLAGHEVYSVTGAASASGRVRAFDRGAAVIGVCGPLYKCLPAPSELALLLHDQLITTGRRGNCTITVVLPSALPLPPSPATSDALVAAFKERGITFMGNQRVVALEGNECQLEDGRRLPADLFLGIPVHRAPQVVTEAGMTTDGWIAVDPLTQRTAWEGVYAIGDVTSASHSKAGVFAERDGRRVARELLRAPVERERATPPGCYIELGAGQVARVDLGEEPTYQVPTVELVHEKREFARSRLERWFG